jgi:hypothetical protein
MQQHWVRADRLKNGLGAIQWEVDYQAHPLLDPLFLQQPSRILSFLQTTYERVQGDDEASLREATHILYPATAADAVTNRLQRITDYLREADIYIREAIQLLPRSARPHVQPSREILGCQDLRCLLGLMFDSQDRRLQYEAQRKLCLARLLIDIDQSRHIQDGPRHKAYFEQMLQESLWRHTRQVHELEVGFHISEDGQSVRYTSRPSEGDQHWTFHSVFLEKPHRDRKIALDVLYHNCRFKRTVDRVSFEIVDGRHRVLERVRWGQMRQHRSGSILSKLIRKGINSPDEISDLIGAMFIVHDEDALNDLLLLLDDCIGNPIGWRNVTDTLGSEQDRAHLDRHSGRGYKVFKGDVDILYADDSHEASHLALKLRQFLYGLVPKIFPRAVYGEGWLSMEESLLNTPV